MKKTNFSYIVSENISLLTFLQEKLDTPYKKTVKNYIKNGDVYVNGKMITNVNFSLKSSDKVELSKNKTKEKEFALNIIYEDEDLIAIDKPAGLLSISNSKEKEVTAFRLVSQYVKNINSKNKIFVVHRLDQDTSGVLLFSKNLRLKEQLQKNWNDLVKTREYICVVSGKLPKKGTFKSYLAINHFQKVYSTKNNEIGKLAITNFETLKYKNSLSLVKVNIETGRRNQIRVHMSENGYPIVGDKKYGCKINPIKRLALHASTLELIDPRTGNTLSLHSDVPSIITDLVR